MVRLALSHRGAPGNGMKCCARGILCALFSDQPTQAAKKTLFMRCCLTPLLWSWNANFLRSYQSAEMIVVCCFRALNLVACARGFVMRIHNSIHPQMIKLWKCMRLCSFYYARSKEGLFWNVGSQTGKFRSGLGWSQSCHSDSWCHCLRGSVYL